MIEELVAEVTEYDFKVALETKKPKSWLKSVSAYANSIGGLLLFGVSDDKQVVGLNDAQGDAQIISSLIKERITPIPKFVLSAMKDVRHHITISLMGPWRRTSELEMRASLLPTMC